eukprot:TRINITY_DN113069_c0_g1_i1.p1 TRINITY_DN113069_c0_g1~~TRINITY_DN113069_c0_g1_i1.p1  ORF type:complete len:211 (-),score=30.93 TRINITY_DN113069_c0_g1_i1:280-912(-)
MALAEGETLPATGGLLVVLWLEIIIYMGIGVYEMFFQDFAKPPPSVRNCFEEAMHNLHKKFHAGICLVLGSCALQGVVSGKCSRFEFEMMFFTLGLIMSMVWNGLGYPFGVKGRLLAIGLKPEFWFQLVLWYSYADAVRLPVRIVCVLLNIHGIAIGLFVVRPKLGNPESFFSAVAESDPDLHEKLQKYGIVPKSTKARESLLGSGSLVN